MNQIEERAKKEREITAHQRNTTAKYDALENGMCHIVIENIDSKLNTAKSYSPYNFWSK